MNKVLIVGASGATGRLLIRQLLDEGIHVVAIVRPQSSLPGSIKEHDRLHEVKVEIEDLSEKELSRYLDGCDAVVSCLGHNLTFKGIFGKPGRLVKDSVLKLCQALEFIAPEKKVKFVLMNTTGNSNRDIPETPPVSQRCVIALLRLILPPHVDNEEAADFLRIKIGQSHPYIEWLAVRPDGLTDEDSVTNYDVHESPIRNVIFNAGKTSRINVAHFMLCLLLDAELWSTWKGKMPVIYNHE